MGKRLGHFTEEDVKVAKEHRIRCSITLTSRKMHIKTTVRYLYTTIRMTKIKNDTLNVGEDVKKLALTLLVEMYNGIVYCLRKFGSFL